MAIDKDIPQCRCAKTKGKTHHKTVCARCETQVLTQKERNERAAERFGTPIPCIGAAQWTDLHASGPGRRLSPGVMVAR